MTELLREYDAKVDNKKRVTIRETTYEYFHIKQYKDGSILLEPRVLVEPNKISKNTLKMMDTSIRNYKKGKTSKAINLEEFSD